MYDGPMQTVKHMRVNMWCMLDWIVGICHKPAEVQVLGKHLIN